MHCNKKCAIIKLYGYSLSQNISEVTDSQVAHTAWTH